MPVVLVLLACLGNALALTLQRKAAQDSARQRGRSAGSFRDMVRRPPWLFGIVIFALAIVCQISALRLGSVSLVQPVLVMELPFTLLVGWWILGGALRPYEWTAVATMSVGLVVMLASLRPHGGDALAAGNLRWILGTLATAAALAITIGIAVTSRAAGKAAFFGIAAGIGSGFVAVIVKAMTDALATGGLGLGRRDLADLPADPGRADRVLDAAERAAGGPAARLPARTHAREPAAGVRLGHRAARRGGRRRAVAPGRRPRAGMLTVGVFLLARSPVLAAQEGSPRDRPSTGRPDVGTARRHPL